MRLRIAIGAVACAWAVAVASTQSDQLKSEDYVGLSQIEPAAEPSGAGHVGCGCGEGKLARVAQATRDFSTRVDALDSNLNDFTAAMHLDLAEVPSIATRYRAVGDAAQAALSGGSPAVTVYQENNEAIEALHKTVLALISVLESTQPSLDKTLAELEQACRQRQPPVDAPMSPEIREWRGACARVDEAGSRYRAEAERGQAAARDLDDLDQLQWQMWRALAERIADAR